MGGGNISAIVIMDDRGRVLIPKSVREKVKARLFKIELGNDGSIILKPVFNDVLSIAGKFKGLIKYESYEELEEKQEEYIRKRRKI